VFSSALSSSLAAAFGDGEGVWALMQISMLPKQAIITATNNFFISVLR